MEGEMKGEVGLVVERDAGGRFLKGRKKTGGRKKIPDEVKRMYKEATPDAARLLIETMNNEKAKIELRISCAEKIVDRVYGKTAKMMDEEVLGDKPFLVEISVV